MKKQLLISNEQLPYIAADGKTYQTDYTNDEGLYMTAAHMRARKEMTRLLVCSPDHLSAFPPHCRTPVR